MNLERGRPCNVHWIWTAKVHLVCSAYYAPNVEPQLGLPALSLSLW